MNNYAGLSRIQCAGSGEVGSDNGGHSLSLRNSGKLWVMYEERLKILWCIRNVPVRVICIYFGWSREPKSTFLTMNRPRIEKQAL